MLRSLTSHQPVEPLAAAAELWRAGRLRYRLWPQQLAIYEVVRGLPRSSQTVVLLCARQFGKSVLGCVLALEDCLRNPGVAVLIVAPSIKQCREIVRPRMKLLMRDCPDGLIHHVKSEDTWYFSNGSELNLGGFDTASCAKRGKTLYKIYVEEIVDSSPDSYLDWMRSDLGPALTHSKNAQIVTLTTLPKVPDHPFCIQTIPEAVAGGAYFKFTIDDNKALTQEQYDACVKRCGGRDSVDFRREYLCEQVRDSSIILAPEFDEATHVRSFERPEYAHFWLSGDVGGVRDKSVFHAMAYDFRRAKILVIGERAFDPDTSTDIIIASVRELERPFGIRSRWVDAPGQLQVDLMSQGFPCALPRKDELDASVNHVRIALRRGEVEIDPSCQLLISTLRSGTFNPQKTDLARTSALGHMDAFMSLCYGLRHANKSNPYPIYVGNQHDFYIDKDEKSLSNSAKTIKSIFAVGR